MKAQRATLYKPRHPYKFVRFSNTKTNLQGNMRFREIVEAQIKNGEKIR